MDVKEILSMLYRYGTEGTIVSLAEGLTAPQERKFFRYYMAVLTRAIEKYSTGHPTEKPIGSMTLKRGTIAELLIRSYEYAKATGKSKVPYDYSCPKCKSESGVLDFDDNVLRLRCRNSKCLHNFELERGTKNEDTSDVELRRKPVRNAGGRKRNGKPKGTVPGADGGTDGRPAGAEGLPVLDSTEPNAGRDQSSGGAR